MRSLREKGCLFTELCLSGLLKNLLYAIIKLAVIFILNNKKQQQNPTKKKRKPKRQKKKTPNAPSHS
jgi:hypothetical protein